MISRNQVSRIMACGLKTPRQQEHNLVLKPQTHRQSLHLCPSGSRQEVMVSDDLRLPIDGVGLVITSVNVLTQAKEHFLQAFASDKLTLMMATSLRAHVPTRHVPTVHYMTGPYMPPPIVPCPYIRRRKCYLLSNTPKIDYFLKVLSH